MRSPATAALSNNATAMINSLFSLEDDLSDLGPAERRRCIAELMIVAALGNCTREVRSRLPLEPLALAACSTGILALAGLASTLTPFILLGAGTLLAAGLTLYLVQQQPALSLMRAGAKVGDTVIPWRELEIYEVTQGAWPRTVVTLVTAPGWLPTLSRLKGRRSVGTEPGREELRVYLWLGPRGFSPQALDDCLADYVAAHHARDQLAHLGYR